MRVISGIAKGRKLKKVPGDSTRPIMDRVKENLFNILGTSVIDGRWLDLFAGTGQVGIEALSRGADFCVFVEKAHLAIRTIQENLKLTGLDDSAKLVPGDAFHYLKKNSFEPFDLIYVAPPQYLGLWKEVLFILDKNPNLFLKPDGMVVIQIDPKEFETITWSHFKLADDRRYGNTQLIFYVF